MARLNETVRYDNIASWVTQKARRGGERLLAQKKIVDIIFQNIVTLSKL